VTTDRELYEKIFLYYLRKGRSEIDAHGLAKHVIERELARGTLKKKVSFDEWMQGSERGENCYILYCREKPEHKCSCGYHLCKTHYTSHRHTEEEPRVKRMAGSLSSNGDRSKV